MAEERLRKNILKKYFSLRYPGSFQGVQVFCQALKDNDDIDISHSALRKILKSSLPYQVNVVKPKKFKTRAMYSRGIGIEAFCDPIFVPYKTAKGEKKNFVALVVCDVHSRFLWTRHLQTVNPASLKSAFTHLFNEGMPEFSIIRCDRDKSLNTLANTYFARRGIVLLPRRSIHHMSFLEGVIRNCKRKLIKHMRTNLKSAAWSPRRLEEALEDVTASYNNTPSSSHGFKPAECNFPEFDPELRLRLYGPDSLERFETLYTQTLKRHKKANTPRTGRSFKEGADDFKKGDLVYIDFKEPTAGRRAYQVRRGPLYRISRVNVLTSPYLYKLLDLSTGKELHGWYYGLELARGDLSDLEIETILDRKTTPDKRKLIKVKYKNHDSSFNHWIDSN